MIFGPKSNGSYKQNKLPLAVICNHVSLFILCFYQFLGKNSEFLSQSYAQINVVFFWHEKQNNGSCKQNKTRSSCHVASNSFIFVDQLATV